MSYRPTVRPCDSCGKPLLWNVAPWPIETTPRDPALCEARAYIFIRNRTGVRAIDARALPGTPDEVYAQHVCQVRRQEMERANEDNARVEAIIDRITRE